MITRDSRPWQMLRHIRNARPSEKRVVSKIDGAIAERGGVAASSVQRVAVLPSQLGRLLAAFCTAVLPCSVCSCHSGENVKAAPPRDGISPLPAIRARVFVAGHPLPERIVACCHGCSSPPSSRRPHPPASVWRRQTALRLRCGAASAHGCREHAPLLWTMSSGRPPRHVRFPNGALLHPFEGRKNSSRLFLLSIALIFPVLASSFPRPPLLPVSPVTPPSRHPS